MSLKEYVQYKGKTVGWVVFDVYHTHRTADTFFRKYHSFGISEDLIHYLEKRGVKTVVVHYDSKKGELWFIAPLEKFYEGRVWYDGEDKQFHLHTKEFKCIMPKNIVVGEET